MTLGDGALRTRPEDVGTQAPHRCGPCRSRRRRRQQAAEEKRLTDSTVGDDGSLNPPRPAPSIQRDGPLGADGGQ
jgi:hypothetical protein